MSRFRPGSPSPALVVSTIALVVALGGTSYAAFSLPKNSVGTKQLKNRAVTAAKLKNGAVTKSKLNVTGLTAPNALHANTANRATNATHASTADTASSAGGAPPTGTAGGDLTGSYPSPTLAPAEAFHEVGAAGEPPFVNGWHNIGGHFETAGFYKDREGVVHLKGFVTGGTTSGIIFNLPAGDRPAPGKILAFSTACTCHTTASPSGDSVSLPTGLLEVLGVGLGFPGSDGAVGAGQVVDFALDGVTFRAAG